MANNNWKGSADSEKIDKTLVLAELDAIKKSLIQSNIPMKYSYVMVEKIEKLESLLGK